MFRITLFTVLAGLALLVPHAAYAEYFPNDRPASGDHFGPDDWGYVDEPMAHDRGFLLRATFAPAWFVSRSDQIWPGVYGSGVRVDGGGLELGAAIGGIVGHNVAIHGTFTSLYAPAPRVTTDRQTTLDRNATSLMLGVGPGITGYLPWNAYASVSFGAAFVRHRFDNSLVVEPDPGVGIYFELMFGKEWWVGPKAGMGFFGRLSTHRVTTDYYAPVGGVTISGGLSFTLN
jgi:hypothetical protein